jgi:hypothetical protein
MAVEEIKSVVTHAGQYISVVIQALLFALIGLAIGLGQLLASKEELTPRIIIGRCLSTAGLAISSGAVLAWMPEIPVLAQIGIAATLASLGTSGLERIVQRVASGIGK